MKIQGVIINVLRKNHEHTEFLYLRRSGGEHRGQWWPVAGTCAAGESPIDTALRELEEETGLLPHRLFRLGLEIPHADEKSRLEAFVAFVGSGNDIELNYEHDSYAWLSSREVLHRVPGVVHPVILHIVKNFVEQEPDIGGLVWRA